MDGEGCVYYDPVGKSRAVILTNTDADLIRCATDALDTLGIRYRVKLRPRKQPHWKDQLNIEIRGRRNLDLFYRWVPFQSPAKVVKLRAALESYIRWYPSERAGANPVDTPNVQEKIA